MAERIEEGTPAVVRGQMLPGVAGICLFMMVTTLMNVFGAMRGAFGGGTAKYAILGLCSLLVLGVLGLLRMRRWGWALVEAGTLMLCVGDFFFFERTHAGFFLVRSLFVLMFFLYLARTEVRERLV